MIMCANCGREIRRPGPGSYPPEVEWVHVWSPLGAGNRYCKLGGPQTARPYEETRNTSPEEEGT